MSASAVKIPHADAIRIPIIPDAPKDWDGVFHCTPGHEFVYVFRDAAERVLYVGITWSAKARWRTHKRRKPWWSEVASAELICRDSDFKALELERHLIKALRPAYNIRSVSN